MKCWECKKKISKAYSVCYTDSYRDKFRDVCFSCYPKLKFSGGFVKVDRITQKAIKTEKKRRYNKMSEERSKYGDSLDKVIEGNNNIYSRLTTLESKISAMIGLYRDVVIDQSYIEARIRRLERAQTYYPMESEIKNIKIGLND